MLVRAPVGVLHQLSVQVMCWEKKQRHFHSLDNSQEGANLGTPRDLNQRARNNAPNRTTVQDHVFTSGDLK